MAARGGGRRSARTRDLRILRSIPFPHSRPPWVFFPRSPDLIGFRASMRMNTRHSGLGLEGRTRVRGPFFSGCCAAPRANGLIWRRVTSTGGLGGPHRLFAEILFRAGRRLIPPSAKAAGERLQPAPPDSRAALQATCREAFSRLVPKVAAELAERLPE